ncbi:hypothetical protein JXQ31_02370 [candidate division KSB1 bacterium]|nr:hypothetical protein [candidate division KSB1 bacterium]
MASLFEDIKNGIRDGIELVVDKTEEYTKIGKLKVDILGIKRNIERLFSELGGQTYELLSKDKKVDISGDEEIKRLVEELKSQEEKLDAKKNEIKKVKEQKEHERRDRDEDRKKEAEEKAKAEAAGNDLGSELTRDDIEDANIIEETDDK